MIAMVLAASLAAPIPLHPMGNFSVNQYHELVLRPDRVEVLAVVDTAEIPSLAQRSAVDTDGDGAASGGERAAYAGRVCADVAAALTVRVGAESLMWTIMSSSFAYATGAGGLDVSRLECALTAPADLNRRVSLSVDNRYLDDQIGWREMTASAEGLRLVSSPLPAHSVTDRLRTYADDLLSSTLDVRQAVLETEPGTGGAGPVAQQEPPSGDPVTRLVASAERSLHALVGGRPTPAIAALAVLLALVLGAAHAALPGHGKTVMAAYLAGTRGRVRDAVAVGGTVTASHTAGVLVIGGLLTAGTAVVGGELMRVLSLISAAVVVAVGIGMLVSLRRRRAHGHSRFGHSHGHANVHHHDHVSSHDVSSHDESSHGHHPGDYYHDDHPHGHEHGCHDHADHHDGDHVHGGHTHDHGLGATRTGRWGLAGIGLAGGLVPSPSALIVLLAAVGLGHTAFGVVLVVVYGLGMAATLTGAGLLMVAAQRRLGLLRRWLSPLGDGRMARLVRWGRGRVPAVPTVTAVMIVAVGIGLTLRAAGGVL